MRGGEIIDLAERRVHIWTLNTAVSDAVASKFESVLAVEEKDRAARFLLEPLRRSFVVARGVLRCLIGRYLDQPPTTVRFNYGSKGKPAVTSLPGIEFNATHSDDLAVFAFTVGCPIGIDLEQIRPLGETQEIADRFFCSEEAVELMSLPPSEREGAFFRCWTRKEAYIKAIGQGLSAPLDQFRVTLRPNESPRFIHISHDIAEAWTLHDLSLASGYAAALAYRDRPRSVSVFPIPDPAEFVTVP